MTLPGAGLGIFLCAAAATPVSETTDRVLQRLDQEWTDAQITGDVEAIGKLLSDDFVSVNPVGGISELPGCNVQERSLGEARRPPSQRAWLPAPSRRWAPFHLLEPR